MISSLIAPHGDRLVSLYAEPDRIDYLRAEAKHYPSWNLRPRQLCDLELLMNGGFSPLQGFMNEADYTNVLERCTLQDTTVWPIPLVLDVTPAFAAALHKVEKIGLRDTEGVLLAVLTIEDLWEVTRPAEEKALFGENGMHLQVEGRGYQPHPIYIGGRIEGIEPPTHYDHLSLRHSPRRLREHLASLGLSSVAALHTREPLHRREVTQARLCATEQDRHLLLHSGIGAMEGEKYDRFTRVRCYEHVLAHFPPGSVTLSLVNLAPRFTGLREILWRAIVAQNFGATHYIVLPSQPRGAFNETALNEKQWQHLASHLGIVLTPPLPLVYSPSAKAYIPPIHGATDETVNRSDIEILLSRSESIPEGFSYPKVIDELRSVYPPRLQQGFTVFFTGLSGAGKSTIAQTLFAYLMERGGRKVTLLDGDQVRKQLSSELGFSKEHRNLHIERLGYIASEITRHGGIAICAPIAPYATSRCTARCMVETFGHFIEIYIATPLEVCAQRDRKGLYARARAGYIQKMTGIDDPYEVPERPEMVIDTQNLSVWEATSHILETLKAMGHL